ncbi:MAG: hypothetical protein M1299_07840 [Firmicutes bacterium]|nr:hypothetical protein [Bacillota bacterium]MCL5039712.1 hypothetical protein [Bacillota bacterium]
MFIVLLLGTLLLSLLVSFVVTRMFTKPVSQMLGRIIPEDISAAWVKYIIFAMYIAGISNGVRVWDLERYLAPPVKDTEAMNLVLNANRIVLELYRTLIGTLQGISTILLLFFMVALIAYVVVRAFETRRERTGKGSSE